MTEKPNDLISEKQFEKGQITTFFGFTLSSLIRALFLIFSLQNITLRLIILITITLCYFWRPGSVFVLRILNKAVMSKGFLLSEPY